MKYNNIYKINTENKRKEKNKILIILISILTIILLLLILMYSIDTIKKYDIYKGYEAQLISLKEEEQEKERQIAIEQEKQRQAKIPKLTEQGINNVEKIYNSETKRVFLTFDDGPSILTTSILDILKQQNIKATFFVLGSRVEAMPEVVSRMYEEGHYIANHGYSHVYETIYATPQSVLDEYNKCNDIVKSVIKVPEYNSHLFRFPGGLVGGKYAEIKAQAKTLLNQNNIVNLDWNALIGDSEKNNATVDFLLQRTKETVGTKNSVVILMHDAQAKKTTVDALPQVIQYLREQGYEFNSFYDIIK